MNFWGSSGLERVFACVLAEFWVKTEREEGEKERI